MRARIDVAEIEAETKIRAKYLRALENEEWDLLPGPTYVKSFLRTYAEALDLDAKLLVDEYKLRHERLSEVELQPINAAAPGRERRRQAPVIPRWIVLVVIFGGLIFALSVLGREDPATDPIATSTRTETQAAPPPAANPPPAARARRVRLQIVARSEVYVCLKSGDRTLVNGATLTAGAKTRTFRGRRLRLTLGNNGVRLIVNGRRSRSVAAASDGIGLEFTPRGRRTLTESKRPVCRS